MGLTLATIQAQPHSHTMLLLASVALDEEEHERNRKLDEAKRAAESAIKR